jgi:hypothetical protein
MRFLSKHCFSICFNVYPSMTKCKKDILWWFTMTWYQLFSTENEETCHLTVLYYVNLSVCTNLFCMNTLLFLLLLLLIFIGTTLYMYRDVIEARILIWTVHERWSCPMDESTSISLEIEWSLHRFCVFKSFVWLTRVPHKTVKKKKHVVCVSKRKRKKFHLWC